VKPTPLSGFPELLPADRFVELAVIERLRTTFELHGFAPIETRAAETIEDLTRKGEIDKEVYVLRRLHAADDEAGSSSLGLHFDLTVPFARYVLENAGKLDFPFRRYQIQKVWRGERPQEGRYREFTQADIDVVARDTLSFHHDIEVARVMAEALSSLDFVPPLRLQINNRKLIEGFYLGVGAPDVAAVMRAIDKIDKVPVDVVQKLLVEQAGLTSEQAERCLALAAIRTTDTSFLGQVDELGVKHDLLSEGLAELAAVIDGCSSATNDRFQVEADLSIARGLDYYTGTVFETRMAGFENLGSICSGGRYDSLATDGTTTYPGVGISLGLTRMLVPLLARGHLTANRSVPSVVLVALANDDSRAEATAIAQALRARGIATELAPSAQKYGRQIRHASRRGIPFVWFPATDESGHEVRDIRSGEQVPADPNTWRPPDADLTPQIVSAEVSSEQEEKL
jgi:histidyl-tRNA synthetase